MSLDSDQLPPEYAATLPESSEKPRALSPAAHNALELMYLAGGALQTRSVAISLPTVYMPHDLLQASDELLVSALNAHVKAAEEAQAAFYTLIDPHNDALQKIETEIHRREKSRAA